MRGLHRGIEQLEARTSFLASGFRSSIVSQPMTLRLSFASLGMATLTAPQLSKQVLKLRHLFVAKSLSRFGQHRVDHRLAKEVAGLD